MTYSVFYTRQAINDLKQLEREVAQRVITKIVYYSRQTNPISFAKKLKPPFEYLYRFRIGEYRATLSISPGHEVTILNVVRVKHRKDAYE